MTKTRAEYEADVARPGKFEGEPAWTPYFYEVSMDGGGEYVYGPNEDDELRYIEMDIDASDRAMFPELANYWAVRLYESEQGFSHTELLKIEDTE